MIVQTLTILLYITSVLASTCLNPVPNTIIGKSVRIPEYYWKDYVGIIPDDAIEGGADEFGKPTYVGQAYIRNLELLPVIITPNCKTVSTTAYATEVTTDANIKILCAKDKEKFEWVFTKNEESHILINRHLVVGGSEVGHTLNIGRIRHGGKLIIGKVFSYPLANSGLWIPYNGVPARFLEYEILTYNYNKKSTNSEERNTSTLTINMWTEYCT